MNFILHTHKMQIYLCHTPKTWVSIPSGTGAMIVRLEGRKRINRTTSKMTSKKDTAGTAAACGSDSCISSAFGGIWFPPSTSSHDQSPHQKGRTSDLGIHEWRKVLFAQCSHKELIARQYVYRSCTSRSHVYVDNTFWCDLMQIITHARTHAGTHIHAYMHPCMHAYKHKILQSA